MQCELQWELNEMMESKAEKTTTKNEKKTTLHNKWDKLQTFMNFTNSMVHKRRCHFELWTFCALTWGNNETEYRYYASKRNKIRVRQKQQQRQLGSASDGCTDGPHCCVCVRCARTLYVTYVLSPNVIARSLQVFIQNYCKLMKSAVIVSGWIDFCTLAPTDLLDVKCCCCCCCCFKAYLIREDRARGKETDRVAEWVRGKCTYNLTNINKWAAGSTIAYISMHEL